jgi:hypothetical protein
MFHVMIRTFNALGDGCGNRSNGEGAEGEVAGFELEGNNACSLMKTGNWGAEPN